MRVNNKHKHFCKITFVLSLLLIFTIYGSLSYSWNKTFVVEEHDCDVMSAELASFFVIFGIPTKVVYGSSPDRQSRHCWLVLFDCIEFESTTLRIKLWDKNENYYKEDVIIKDLDK